MSVAQRSHAQAAKRAAQEEKHAALKNVLHNMSTNWVARIERHPAVYLTQCAMVVFSVLFYCLETLQELEDVIPDLVWYVAVGHRACSSATTNCCMMHSHMLHHTPQVLR